MSNIYQMKASLRSKSPGPVYWFDVVDYLGARFNAHCVYGDGIAKWYAEYAATGEPVVITSTTYNEIVAACLPLVDEPHTFVI